MELKIKHLEFIQNVINRMANNSFLLKGWSVVLISALFALSAKDTNPFFIYLAYFPCAIFWSLDGYFLRQERMYRKLYDEVRAKKQEDINFDLNASKFSGAVESWSATCFSITLRMFHGSIFGVIVLIMIILIATGSK